MSSAVSRKTHGGAGTFDIPLPLGPLSGAIGVEDRVGVAGVHQVVATFASPVTVGGVSVTTGAGSVSSSSVVGGVVTINLGGVTNAQRLGVTLLERERSNESRSVMVPMGVLAGDTSVMARNAKDVSQTKGQSGQGVTVRTSERTWL